MEFVVSSEREGNAKAIMDQRNSMNITNTVASDSFGDNAEGNVGDLFAPFPADAMTYYPVSTRVNSVRHDSLRRG